MLLENGTGGTMCVHRSEVVEKVVVGAPRLSKLLRSLLDASSGKTRMNAFLALLVFETKTRLEAG